MRSTVHGVIAALLTPRDMEGSVASDSLRRNIDFVLDEGAQGVCVLGATGEYHAMSMNERKKVVDIASHQVRGRAHLVVCAGAPSFNESVHIAEYALGSGADVILLPPPFFFRYSQADMECFYTEAARRIGGPILLYNLPMFTNPIETPLAVRLINRVEKIVGIKDSSGGLDTLRAFNGIGLGGAVRLLGNDRVIPEALRTRCCDGFISGIAGVLPELSVALYEGADGWSDESPTVLMLEEVVSALDTLPVPWGLKLIAEARGLFDTNFSVPLSEARQGQLAQFAAWCSRWSPDTSPSFFNGRSRSESPF